VSAEQDKSKWPDPGLAALVMLLRFHGLGTDPEQIRHRFGRGTIGIPEMLRCAKELGLKAHSRLTTWERLVSTPMPAIVALRDGGFLLLGKVGDGKALVQSPLAPRPTMMTRAEFEAAWDGHLVLMTRRAGLVDLSRRFDITWFLGAIHKYRRLLGEVLVHRTLSTLDVLIIGLVAIAIFETILGILRTYLFAHTTNRIDVELGARLFRRTDCAKLRQHDWQNAARRLTKSWPSQAISHWKKWSGTPAQRGRLNLRTPQCRSSNDERKVSHSPARWDN